ncbi:MAG TPA: metal ABC transporter ATP-binding protein [Marmoricola sp.]|jgi:zinc/manganese transport system ATP-binding protein|nr:metal ABC transporter ATP-binding protein [Marmoricola sp.]
MTSPVLRLDRAGLRYGDRQLWSGLTLDVAPGEFIAVLGANGSGKTSLLKVLLGLQQLSAGTVTISGRPVCRGNRDIGYVQQQRRLDPSTPLRARDAVRQGLDGYRWGFARPGTIAWGQVEAALDAVGAAAYADQPVALLSGGEQQRVRIAQALVADPSLLLCDEPLLSLDLSSQRTITGLVDRRRHEHGTAVLFVTHEINPVLPYVDRVLYLAGGRFQIGTVEEVMSSATLSELYDAPIEVIRVGGRILVAGIPEDAHHTGPERESA